MLCSKCSRSDSEPRRVSMGNQSGSKYGTLPHQVRSKFLRAVYYCTTFRQVWVPSNPNGIVQQPWHFPRENELTYGLAFVWTYIDDLLCLTKGSFNDHFKKVELILQRLLKAGLKVKVTKSFFARSQLVTLGCWITRTGIKPVCEKVKAVPKN